MDFYEDIGHGETINGRADPGAVNGSLVEHQINIVVGKALADRLIEHGHNVKIEPGDLTINASAQAANAFGADFCISCHENAGGGDRGEVIYSWDDKALALAKVVAVGLTNAGQTKVNVVKCPANTAGTAEKFGMLRIPKMPAIIIEPCFIDNALDRQLVDTVEEQKHVGICIADAIAAVYGSALKEDDYVSDVKIVAGGKIMTGVILKDGRSYAPVRELAESLGCKVGWNEALRTVTITK